MPKFRLVRREGEDTLHRSPSFEECQVDDAADPVTVEMSMDEASSLVEGGSAHACQHCLPLGMPSEDLSGK